MKITSVLFLSGLLSLSACAFSPWPTPQGVLPPAISQRNNQGFFQSALLKRPLLLKEENGFTTPLACLSCNIQTGFNIQQAAMTKPAIAPMHYYGGHDFNQYSIQFAEENIYPAAQGNSLVEVFRQSVQPLLREWDSTARLIESRAIVNSLDPEYIQLPGRSGEPMKILPRYIYRLASTPLKQTLNVYVLEDEIRVHRMVWGENQIDISRVKIDSDQVMELARKAVANSAKDPGYPVYPSAADLQNPSMKVIYKLPEKLVWQIHLNQQEGQQLRYFVSFFYGQADGGAIASPVPMVAVAEPALAKTQSEASSSDAGTAPNQVTSVQARPIPDPAMPWSGSLEIDAISGKIIALNRPVIYYPDVPVASGGSSGAVAGSPGIAVTEPAPIPQQ